MNRFGFISPLWSMLGKVTDKLTGTAAKVGGTALGATGGLAGVAVIDEAVRGGDSVLSRGQQNIAEAAAAETAAGGMAGFKENIANLLNFISTLFENPPEFLKSWEQNLRKNIDRTNPEKGVVEGIGDLFEGDGGAALTYGLTAAGTAAAGWGLTNMGIKALAAKNDGSAVLKGNPAGYKVPTEHALNRAAGQMDLFDDAARSGGRFSNFMSKLPFVGKFFKGAAVVTTVAGVSMAGLGALTGEAEAAENPGAGITTENTLQAGGAEVGALGLSILGTNRAIQATQGLLPALTSNVTKGAASLGLKAFPGLGAVIAAGEGLYDTAKYALNGEWEKAGTRFVAGVGETVAGVGGIITYGTLGTAWREATRAGGIMLFGQDKAIDHSYVVQGGQWLFDQFTGAHNNTQVAENNQPAPSRVFSPQIDLAIG